MKVPGNVWGQEWGICEYADTVYPLLETDGWAPPGRSVSPHLGGGGTVVALFPPPVPFPLVIWDCLTHSLSPPFCLSLSTSHCGRQCVSAFQSYTHFLADTPAQR